MLAELGQLFQPHITNTIDKICGVPYAALPIATVVSMQTNMPMLIKRKEVKSYGTKKLIEGKFSAGDKVLLIEDVITTGESLVETIKELESEGLIIEQILVVLDREQGGTERLAGKGYKIKSLFTISSVISILLKENKIDEATYNAVTNFLIENKIIKQEVKVVAKSFPKNHQNPIAQRLLDIANKKQSNIIASVDVTTTEEVLSFLKKVGSKICAAKLHVDIISNFSQAFINELKNLSSELDFLIIEDRKFADIGNTQLLQLTKGIYNIASWADMITIHLIAGEPALKALQHLDSANKPALIPVIEMSSEGALTDKNYITKCKSFMYQYSDVIGAVCQTEMMENNLLKFTPGINLSSTKDNKGQNYNSPKFAIETLQSDFLIVGRGLYEAQNPAEEIEKYLSEVRSLLFINN